MLGKATNSFTIHMLQSWTVPAQLHKVQAATSSCPGCKAWHCKRLQHSHHAQAAKLDKASFLAELRGVGKGQKAVALPAGTGPATASPAQQPSPQPSTAPGWGVLSDSFGLPGMLSPSPCSSHASTWLCSAVLQLRPRMPAPEPAAQQAGLRCGWVWLTKHVSSAQH